MNKEKETKPTKVQRESQTDRQRQTETYKNKQKQQQERQRQTERDRDRELASWLLGSCTCRLVYIFPHLQPFQLDSAKGLAAATRHATLIQKVGTIDAFFVPNAIYTNKSTGKVG